MKILAFDALVIRDEQGGSNYRGNRARPRTPGNIFRIDSQTNAEKNIPICIKRTDPCSMVFEMNRADSSIL